MSESSVDPVNRDSIGMDLKQMNESRKEGKYVDFTIYVGDKSFPVHRVVLDTRSEYFKLLFTAKMKENDEHCCHMHEVTAIAVERALDFLYGEELVLDDDVVVDVLKVCHMWQLAKAVKECESFLIEKLGWKNFIFSFNLAKFYDLEVLRKKCCEFILSNRSDIMNWSGMVELERGNLLEIIVVAADMNNSVSQVWNACIEWDKLQTGEGSALCELIQELPSKVFKNSSFLLTIYKDAHTEKCERCKTLVKRQISSFKPEYLDTKNVVPMKLLAKKFHCQEAENLADTSFVQHHEEVFPTPAILDLEESDILKYMTVINEGCSSDELSGLIRWMRQSAEAEKIFPKIFDEKKLRADSPFLKNVRDFTEILKPEDFFFVVRLAETNRISSVLKTLAKYLEANLHRIAELPEFSELVVEQVIKYLKIATTMYQRHFTDHSQRTLWNATMRWLDHNRQERRLHFPRLLRALPMEDFSYAFMRDTVLKCGLFSETDVLLTNIVLNKAIKSSSAKRPAVVLLKRQPRS